MGEVQRLLAITDDCTTIGGIRGDDLIHQRSANWGKIGERGSSNTESANYSEDWVLSISNTCHKLIPENICANSSRQYFSLFLTSFSLASFCRLRSSTCLTSCSNTLLWDFMAAFIEPCQVAIQNCIANGWNNGRTRSPSTEPWERRIMFWYPNLQLR